MNDSAMPREYDECEYALFISYAHADDTSNNEWVGALRDALWNRLHGLPGDITRRGIHFSQENGPSAGHLGHELRERLKSSFAMLLVVGGRYAHSLWCERELQMFKDVFGKEATRSRLYVVAMSQKALKDVSSGALWQEVVAPDQVCVDMYQKMSPNEPIPARNDRGGISQTMHEASRGAADRLGEQIMLSVAKQKAAPAPPKVQQPAAAATTSKDRLQVVIGPCTPNLAGRVATLNEALQRCGATVSMLERSVIDNYDPDAEFPLGREFAVAHTLVMPFSEIKPIKPDQDGGHVALVKEAWAKLKRSREIVWFRPADLAVDEGERALPRHLEIFNRLEPVYASEKAVVNQLFSRGNTLRVYIEKNRQEPAYWLAKEIDAAWEALPPDAGRPPLLDYAFIELGDLGSIADDAAGVVLLMPEGIKPPNSLYSQIESVRRAFPRRGMYPGVVACIFNPPPRVQAGLVHDWAEIHFYRNPQDTSKYMVDHDNKRWLNGFVEHIWSKYKNEGRGLVH